MSYQKYYVKDVKEKSSEKLFNVISCFAGGGGSSTGYRLAGANILLINEFVEEAISTYQANFPDTNVLVDDIKKYTSDDFLEMAGIKVGELDLLDGSPPCSAFSLAGKRNKGWEGYVEDTRESSIDLETGEVVQTGELKKKDGIKKYSEDKIQESIEDLFLEYIRIAKGIQPKVIVAENVKGITFGESKKKLLEFINDFEKANKISSIIAIIGLLNLPVIKYSVDWWNTLHQPSSITLTSAPTIHYTMLIPLIIMLLGLVIFSLIIFLMKYKTEIIKFKLDKKK